MLTSFIEGNDQKLVFDYQDLNFVFLKWLDKNPHKDVTVLIDSLFKANDKDTTKLFYDIIKDKISLSNVRFGVSSLKYSKYGATSIQESAFTLAQIVDFLETFKDDISPEILLKRIDVILPVGSHYFFEIAKFRSFRYLWQFILKSYDLEPFKCPLFTISSEWNKSIYDQETNLLRLTTEAMSAGIGSADIIFTPAYDIKTDKKMTSQRYSANINNLLKNETHIDQVIDASYGSYYIESITERIIDKSYALFQEIESLGGFIKADDKGFINSEIKSINDIKKADMRSGKLKSLGTNLHPKVESIKSTSYEFKNYSFNHPSLLQFIKNDSIETKLKVESRSIDLISSSTQEYDLLRQNTYKPSIAIVEFGDPAMKKARSSFIKSILVLANLEANNVELKESLIYDIVFYCSSDKEYDELTLSEDLKKSTNQKRYIAGNLYNQEAFNEIYIAQFVHLKTDRIEFLTELLSGGSHE